VSRRRVRTHLALRTSTASLCPEACSVGNDGAPGENPGLFSCGGYSFFQTGSAANSRTAFDRTFITSAATLSKVAGLVIVGLTGHLIATALGRSLPGSTNSIFSVWPLMRPEDSGVDDWDKAEFAFRLGRGERLRRDPGPTYWVSTRPNGLAFYPRRNCTYVARRSEGFSGKCFWLGAMLVGDTGSNQTYIAHHG
jgi:hypothetical protein